MALPDIILLDGPVGSGKGTQANLIARKYGYYQFGFGTELRDFVSANLNSKDSKDYTKALKIQEIMRLGENVTAEDLFYAAGTKLNSLIQNGSKIIIDSAKTMEAFEWLAETAFEKNLKGLLIHLELDIATSLERLSHRYYVPSLKDIPFNSLEQALSHCNSNEVPTRREDDLNTDRIHRQFDLYYQNRETIKKIMTANGSFNYAEILANNSIEVIFESITEYLDSLLN